MRASKVLLGLAVVAAMLAVATAASAAQPHRYVCRGGDIAGGRYRSVVVTGTCFVPSGTVDIERNLTIAPGALLDAISPAAGGPGAALPGTVNVAGNVKVGPGAVLGLGCGPSVCNPPLGSTDDRVGGSITGFGALAVIVHSATIGRNVTLLGGGGGPAVEGPPATGACFALAPPAIWASDPNLGGFPPYTDLEGNSVGGNLTILGLQSCWTGALRNTVRGDVFYAHNSMGDPDANEVVNNTIGGGIVCYANTVAVEYGDSGATPNVVSGVALGECGFNVSSPDPKFDGGGPQPISTKAP